MNQDPSFVQQIPTNPINSTVAQCTGWTEFFNPNIGVGGTDFFFFGLTKDCTASGGAGGFVAGLTDSSPPTVVTTTISPGTQWVGTGNYTTHPSRAPAHFT